MNEGQKILRYLPSSQTGISITGEVRDILALDGLPGRYLFLRNNDTPRMYKVDIKSMAYYSGNLHQHKDNSPAEREKKKAFTTKGQVQYKK
jgi:hypothetical protein